MKYTWQDYTVIQCESNYHILLLKKETVVMHIPFKRLLKTKLDAWRIIYMYQTFIR